MSHARRWAVGSVGAVVVLLAVPAPSADAGNGDWEMLRWGIEGGASVIGESWTVAGTISAPTPADSITDIAINLERLDPSPGCPDLSQTFHVRDPGLPVGGDDEESTTTTTSDPSVTTSTTIVPAREDEHRFRYTLVPRCNGRYRVSVVGTAVRLGTDELVSEPLYLGDPGEEDDSILVGLSAPDVQAVSATVAERQVTVAFQPPAAYLPDAGGPPPDLIGYIIEYTFDGGQSWHGFLAVGPATFTATRPLPGTDPAGNYQFRVRGARTAIGLQDHALSAGGPTSLSATVAIGAAPPPPATPTTRRPGGRGVPQQGTPTTEYDTGFEELLDYGEDLEEGDEEPTLPDDAASFLDFVPENTGSAILVPFAIAECLAVWALHLRYLARRVDDG